MIKKVNRPAALVDIALDGLTRDGPARTLLEDLVVRDDLSVTVGPGGGQAVLLLRDPTRQLGHFCLQVTHQLIW